MFRQSIATREMNKKKLSKCHSLTNDKSTLVCVLELLIDKNLSSQERVIVLFDFFHSIQQSIQVLPFCGNFSQFLL
jgi:hypothetical protein